MLPNYCCFFSDERTQIEPVQKSGKNRLATPSRRNYEASYWITFIGFINIRTVVIISKIFQTTNLVKPS